MRGSLLSNLGSVRWDWWNMPSNVKGRLFTSSGEPVGRLLNLRRKYYPGGEFGLLAHLYECRFELQDKAGACVGHLVGPDSLARPYAWVLNAEGTVVASLAAQLCAPSVRVAGRRGSARYWFKASKAVDSVRFVVFRNGAVVGFMNPQMSTIRTSDGPDGGLLVRNDGPRRCTFTPFEALPEDLVDTFAWIALLAALCHRKHYLNSLWDD